MIIAIDGYEANVGKRVGVSRYAFEILTHLYKVSRSHTVRVYLPDPPAPDFPSSTPLWHYRITGPKKFWTLFGLPLALASDRPKADVVYSPTHYIPRFTNIPRVMAIMDVSYLRFPELFRKKDLYQLINWTQYSISRAEKILTISEFTKRDIIDEYKVPEERVVVTHPALSLSHAMTKATRESVRSKYDLNDAYILSVGTLQPRKNFVRLIEAFSHVRSDKINRKPDLQLVIVGKKGWLYEETLGAPRKFGVSDHVKFLDFVPDEELPELYRGAICFALPSLYEGFGLPVLEAMAYECLVVVSATSSLPEIAGQAGIYVNPESTEDIEKGLLTALKEQGRPSGKARVEKGLAQAKKFTWEKAAEKTLEVLESVGGKS